MRYLFLFLFLPALLIAGSSVPDTFPDIKGWEKSVDAKTYAPDDLFQLIDGAAEVFVSYGFVDLQIVEYKKDGGLPVRMEVYRHNLSVNAFGMYAAERQPTYSFIDVGAQGYIEDGVLNFLSGVYYVKITTDIPKQSGRDAMTAVAQSCAKYFQQPSDLPRGLLYFPQNRKVKNSEGYVVESYLGYKCLHSAFTAMYEDTARIQLFVVPCDAPASAQTMLGAALREFGQNVPASLKDGVYPAVDPHSGPVHFLLKGSALCGVVNCGDSAKSLLYLQQLKMLLPR